MLCCQQALQDVVSAAWQMMLHYALTDARAAMNGQQLASRSQQLHLLQNAAYCTVETLYREVEVPVQQVGMHVDLYVHC